MFSKFLPCKCMYTESRRDETSSLRSLFVVLGLSHIYYYIHKMYGHVLTIFEGCKCTVSEVNKTIQKGENTRTNKVS